MRKTRAHPNATMRYLLTRHTQSVLLLIFLISGGCSSVQTINTGIPQKYIEKNQSINPLGATSVINISRKESFFASAAYYWIDLNSVTIMALRSGDYTSFKIQPGDYQLTVHCFGDGSWHDTATKVTIQSGDVLFFEMSPALKGYCDILAVTKDAFLKDYKNPTKVDFGVVPDPNR